MIKATATGPNGEKLLIFGISDRNVELMREGRPISFGLDDLGVPNVTVILTTGQTEDHIAASLSEFIGPNTRVVGGH